MELKNKLILVKKKERPMRSIYGLFINAQFPWTFWKSPVWLWHLLVPISSWCSGWGRPITSVCWKEKTKTTGLWASGSSSWLCLLKNCQKLGCPDCLPKSQASLDKLVWASQRAAAADWHRARRRFAIRAIWWCMMESLSPVLRPVVRLPVLCAPLQVLSFYTSHKR